MAKNDKLSEVEMGRIALKILKKELERKPLPTPKDFRSDMKNAAREIDETVEKLMAFYAAILPELIGRMFGCKNVGLTLSDED